jgi:hypothetical protein
MTAELVARPTRRAAGWAGRASQLRRNQVRSVAPGSAGQVTELWSSVIEVLQAVGGPSTAVLCTAEGASVATYGLSRSEQLRAPAEARHLFDSHRQAAADLPAEDAAAVVTAEVTSGGRCAVVAKVPSPAHGDHLLLVSAEAVSPPLLHAWTLRAAEDLREILSAAGE